VTRSAFREHFAVRRVQCGEQRGGSVASIIVSHSFDITQSQWQSFGWMKMVGMLKKVKLRGIDKVGWLFTFTGAAYNLCRL